MSAVETAVPLWALPLQQRHEQLTIFVEQYTAALQAALRKPAYIFSKKSGANE